MSATKDGTQSTLFIYSNFYQLYLKGKEARLPKSELTTGMVLKTRASEAAPAPAEVRVVSPAETEAFAEWTSGKSSPGRSDLAQQLQTLRQARKRLTYMMQEIDEILKRA
jgi:hypothetical protein